jgi:hypothetical protein
MSDEDLKDELERLRKENAALKKGASSGIRMKVSEKGAVSIYGMGRFPVTLYKEQWLKLLDMSGRYSGVHCCERSAIKGERLNCDGGFQSGRLGSMARASIYAGDRRREVGPDLARHRRQTRRGASWRGKLTANIWRRSALPTSHLIAKVRPGAGMS